jgi:hypothetical protein
MTNRQMNNSSTSVAVYDSSLPVLQASCSTHSAAPGGVHLRCRGFNSAERLLPQLPQLFLLPLLPPLLVARRALCLSLLGPVVVGAAAAMRFGSKSGGAGWQKHWQSGHNAARAKRRRMEQSAPDAPQGVGLRWQLVWAAFLVRATRQQLPMVVRSVAPAADTVRLRAGAPLHYRHGSGHREPDATLGPPRAPETALTAGSTGAAGVGSHAPF